MYFVLYILATEKWLSDIVWPGGRSFWTFPAEDSDKALKLAHRQSYNWKRELFQLSSCYLADARTLNARDEFRYTLDRITFLAYYFGNNQFLAVLLDLLFGRKTQFGLLLFHESHQLYTRLFLINSNLLWRLLLIFLCVWVIINNVVDSREILFSKLLSIDLHVILYSKFFFKHILLAFFVFDRSLQLSLHFSYLFLWLFLDRP